MTARRILMDRPLSEEVAVGCWNLMVSPRPPLHPDPAQPLIAHWSHRLSIRRKDSQSCCGGTRKRLRVETVGQEGSQRHQLPLMIDGGREDRHRKLVTVGRRTLKELASDSECEGIEPVELTFSNQIPGSGCMIMFF